jgi:outer membrane protein TolC
LARVRQAGAFEDPVVDLGLAPLSIGSSNARVGYEVGISQKLPWFGKRSLEASAAAAEADASKNDFEAMRRELALTAVGLYDQYFVAVRSLEINSEHVELMHVIRGGATAQFESGRGAAQDSLQAESALAHMEHDTAVLASQREIVVAQMNELLHRDPGAPLPPPPKELSLPPGPDVRDPKRLETEAASQRPDIVALRERARAEQTRADRASREYYPDVTVSTSYNSMWDMPEHRWMVGLGFNLPIQTGARAGAADEATAMRAQFESDASRLEASARTQVFVSLKQLEESRHVLRLFEERLLPVARDQIDAARAGFTTSRNPFMAVIEAERNLRILELDYQMARADCDRRHAELECALGRIPGLDGKDRSDDR